MGIIKKQSIKSAIYIYLGVGLGYLTRAELFPSYLSEAEIGLLALIVNYASIFAQLATLGFNQATIKYFPHFRDATKKHHGFISMMLLIALVGFSLIWIAYPWISGASIDAESSPLLAQYFYLTLPLAAALLLFNVFDTYNVVLYNASTGIFLREFVLRALFLIGLLPLIAQMITFDQYVFFYVASFGAIALLIILFIAAKGALHLVPDFGPFDKSLIKAMVSISIFGLFTGFGSMAILSIDNIMINWYYDEAATGIYAINFFFATLVLLPSRGLNRIAPTLIADAFKAGQINRVEDLQVKSSINQLIIGLLIFGGLMINLENVYQILPPVYRQGLLVIVFIGLANLVKMNGGVTTAIIGFSKYYKFNAFFMGIWLALLVITNIIFIPKMGISGAALASLISVSCFELIKFIFLKSRYQLQPYGLVHLKAVAIALMAYAGVYFLPPITPFVIDILVRSTLFCLLFIPLTYYLNISENINAIIDRMLVIIKIK